MEDPIAKFAEWMTLAEKSGEKEPTAMSLATVGADFKPSVRTVLLKGFDESGFVFYTNEKSRKGMELAQNQHAALCFYWTLIDKQVRIVGKVSQVTEQEADAYFATRPRISQLGAWASHQSAVLASPVELNRRLAEYEEKYKDQEIPRPRHWTGFRVRPDEIEFWSKGDYRLHDRKVFIRKDGVWESKLLNP